MPFKFKKLEIWNLSMDFVEEIYELRGVSLKKKPLWVRQSISEKVI